MTIAISGKTTVPEARKLAEKHLSNIVNQHQDFASPLDWANVPPVSRVTWDANQTNVSVLWKSPEDPFHRVCLSLLASMSYQRLMLDEELKEMFHMTVASNNMWPVGDLPLFVFGAVKRPEDIERAHELLANKFADELRTSAKSPHLLKMAAAQYEYQQKTNWKLMKNQTKMLTRMGRSEQQALQMIVLQDALNRITARRLLGNDIPGTAAKIRALEKQDIQEIVDAALVADNRRVVIVQPKPAD